MLQFIKIRGGGLESKIRKRLFRPLAALVYGLCVSAAAAAILYAAVRAAADAAGGEALTIGNAEIRVEKDAAYFRLRAPKPAKTRYGIFRFLRDGDIWQPLGPAASFDKPVDFASRTVRPDDFFYPRNEYREIELAGLTYKIENLNNRVTISIHGKAREGEYFTSDEIRVSAGAPVFRFRYLTPTRLWFDMRIEGEDRPYSAGIGFLDLRTKKIQIINPNEMEPKHGTPLIVSEMAGDGDNVWLGIAYCDEPTCLRNGIVLRIGADGKVARRWYSGEKGIPTGAVIRVMPDGDSLWIVTTDGIALVRRDVVKRFRISGTADIIEGGGFGFQPGKTPLPVTPGFATSSAGIRDIHGDHFLMKTRAPLLLWVLFDENKDNFKGAADTIKLISGGTLSLRTANDPTSPRAFLTPAGGEKLIFKVADRQPGGLAVEIPDMLWFSPDAVRLRIVRENEFPADNFLPAPANQAPK